MSRLFAEKKETLRETPPIPFHYLQLVMSQIAVWGYVISHFRYFLSQLPRPGRVRFVLMESLAIDAYAGQAYSPNLVRNALVYFL